MALPPVKMFIFCHICLLTIALHTHKMLGHEQISSSPNNIVHMYRKEPLKVHNDLGFRLRCLSNRLKRAADRSPAKAQMEHVTGTHGWVIGYLYHHRGEDIFQRDLEKEFNMRRSTASGILQLMEKNGLIRRESVKNDGRLKKLVLTDKALDLHESFTRDIRLIETIMLEGVSREELDAFKGTLEKLCRNLDQYEQQQLGTEETTPCT